MLKNDKIVQEMSELSNKENWGNGPWLNEPDEYSFEYKGFPCVLIRPYFMGTWCGYVGIPKDSKWAQEEEYKKIDVHGGITWSDNRLPNKKEDGLFWVGFECGHYGDFWPSMEKYLEINRKYMRLPPFEHEQKTYRTMEYVIEELKKVVDQIEK